MLRHRTKHGFPPPKSTTSTSKNFNYIRNYANSTSPRMTRARGSTEDSASATMSQQIRCHPINKKLSRVSHPRPHQRPGRMSSFTPEVENAIILSSYVLFYSNCTGRVFHGGSLVFGITRRRVAPSTTPVTTFANYSFFHNFNKKIEYPKRFD